MIPAPDPAACDDLLIAEVHEKLKELTPVQREQVYKAITAFHTIFKGYGRLESELALGIFVFELTGTCIVEVQRPVTQ